MKTKLICALWTVALLTTIGIAAAKELPMKGQGTGVITGPPTPGPDGLHISAIGQGEATHLGTFTREEAIVLNPDTGAITGTVTFTAADGSELECSIAGGFTGQNTLAGLYTCDGGSGRFEDAAASAYFSVVQTSAVDFTFEFAGTIELH